MARRFSPRHFASPESSSDLPDPDTIREFKDSVSGGLIETPREVTLRASTASNLSTNNSFAS